MRQIVQEQVNKSVMAYERKVGHPRHAANQQLLNQIKGGITALKVLGGVAISLAGLYIAYHHK